MHRFFAHIALLLFVLVSPARADVLVTDYISGAIDRLDPTTGALLGQFVPPGQITVPTGIVYNPVDSLVYVAAQGSNQILRYNLNGTLHDIFKDLNTFTDPVNPLPAGTTYAPTTPRFSPVTGDLYVSRNLNAFYNPAAAGHGTVDRFDKTTGAFVGSVMTGMSGPGGSLFASNGDLYASSLQSVAGTQSQNGLGYINKTPNGGSQAYFVAPETSALFTPGGLAFQPGTGNIVVTDVVGGSVHQYSPTGSPLADLIAPGGVLQGKYPSDIYFDPLGRMWIANIGDPSTTPPTPGSVMIFDPASPTPQAPIFTTLGINASSFGVTPVPEPGTLLLVGGAAAVGFIVRRKKR